MYSCWCFPLGHIKGWNDYDCDDDGDDNEDGGKRDDGDVFLTMVKYDDDYETLKTGLL